MKKTLLATAMVIAFAPGAFAQDKYNRTYEPQDTSTPAPAARATAPAASVPMADTPMAAAPATTHYSDSSSSALTGAYIGAYGGYGSTDADTAAGTADIDGADYGVFAGYKLDHYLQDSVGINGAVEAYYGDSSADGNIGATTYEKNQEYGVNFRPGISIDESFNPYAILGWRRTEFETSTAAGSSDDNYDGFDLGIGTEFVAWGDIGMRIDYIHTFYEEQNGIDPDEDNIRVGVAYHF